MALARRDVVAIDLSGERKSGKKNPYDALYDLMTVNIPEAAARKLDALVGQAMALFDTGADPNAAYREFDVETFAGLLVLDRKAAVEALSAFTARRGEEKMAAAMFVSTAILAINNTDPIGARFVLGEILARAKKEDSLKPMAFLVLATIAETASGMEAENGFSDPSLSALAESCARRLSQYVR
ncbi:MAG: hypothetical protein AB1324_06905 [Candidatus Micrarchaeota archaeon]